MLFNKSKKTISVSNLADYASSPNDFVDRKRKGLNAQAKFEGDKFHLELGLDKRKTSTGSSLLYALVVIAIAFYCYFNLF